MENKVMISTDNGEVELTKEIVRNFIATGSDINDKEIYMFMQLCKYRNLNPFIREAYLVKFGKQASFIVSKDVFTRRLNESKDCTGWEAGVIVKSDTKIIERKGTFYDDESEKLLGAWFEVTKKNWTKPYKYTINFKDYCRYDRNGKEMGLWATMPAIMIYKCAIVGGVRNTFPEDLGGVYAAEEMPESENSFTERELPKKPEPVKPIIYISNDEAKKILEECRFEYYNLKIDTYTILNFVLKQFNIEKIEYIPSDKFNNIIKYIKEIKKKKEKEYVKGIIKFYTEKNIEDSKTAAQKTIEKFKITEEQLEEICSNYDE